MNKRILLIEDNPVSREFLFEALKPLPISIDLADTLANACLLAEQHEHALFLCDVHLPDGGPRTIFQSLRQCRPDTAIVAITAEASPAACAGLVETGYQEVWGKPIAMAELQNHVSRLLDITHEADRVDMKPGHWDEPAALRAVGNNPATLAALRRMFLAELPQQVKNIELAQMSQDIGSIKGECHKLLASCGFVGAARLSQSVKLLSENPCDKNMLASMLIEAEQCLDAN